MSVVRGLALRRVLLEPGRTALLVLGVSLGVAVVVAVRMLNATAVGRLGQVSEVAVGAGALVVEGGATGVPLELVATVRGAPGVARATPLLTRSARVALPEGAPEDPESPGGDGGRVLVLGLDPTDQAGREAAAKEQGLQLSPFLAAVAKDPCVVAGPLARRRGLKAGSRLELFLARGRRAFTVIGTFEPKGAAAEATGGDVVLLPLPLAMEAFGLPGRVDRIGVELAQGADPEAVTRALRERLPPGYDAKAPGSDTLRPQALMGTVQLGLQLASLLALLIGQFLVYNAMAIAVVRRRPEIGVLRAVGMTRLQVALLLLAEAFAFGVLGACAGVFIGWAIAQAAVGAVNQQVSYMYAALAAADAGLDRTTVIIGLLSGPIATVLAALPPVVQALLVSPVEAARKDLPRGRPERAVRLAALGGLALLLGGAAGALAAGSAGLSIGPGMVVLVGLGGGAALLSPLLLGWAVRGARPLLSAGLGPTGALACDDAQMHPIRTGTTVAALMIALGGVLGIAGLVQSLQTAITGWVEHVLTADLYAAASTPIGTPSNTLLAAEVGAELASVPGVAEVYPIRFTFEAAEARKGAGLAEPRPTLVTSVDLGFLGNATRLPVVEGSADAVVEIARDPADRVAIASNLAKQRGYRVGDRITLRTPSGPWSPTVAVVILDYTSDHGCIFVHRPEFIRRWGDDRANAFDLFCAPGSTPAQITAVAGELRRRFGPRYDLFVTENQAFRKRIMGVVEATFTVTFAMQVVAIGVALLGVVTTLFASTLERTREIGVLRAVGATRGQIARAVVTEAVLLGVVSALLGAALGGLLGVAIVTRIVGGTFGWDLVYVYPWKDALAGGALATALAALAGVLPALRASRVEIVYALSYD